MSKRKIVFSKSFEKAYLKFLGKMPNLRLLLEQVLYKLEEDAFSPGLKTHKLSGNLYSLYACSCGYNCRIVFSIEKDKVTHEEIILLINIGTHDEVY